MESICVSIFMLTYNQEKLISQAIEGVLMQKTNFRYELVIGEDSSTDQTAKICKEYAARYPEKIKLLLNNENIGIGANYIKTYQECTGKYVAICDGDDYWIDPLKLQKQVDFLEKNSDYRIVYTNNYNLFSSGVVTEPNNYDRPQTTFFEDLIQGNYIASVTVLFKREPLTEKMCNWIPHFPFGDWPTYLLVLAGGGNIFFLDESTAVYRKDFGTSTSLRKEKSKMGEIIIAILGNLERDDFFKDKREVIRRSKTKYRIGLMASYNKEKNFWRAFQILKGSILKKDRFYYLRIYLYSIKQSLSSGTN